MGLGHLSDKGHWHFLNSTCDMGTPCQGPLTWAVDMGQHWPQAEGPGTAFSITCFKTLCSHGESSISTFNGSICSFE